MKVRAEKIEALSALQKKNKILKIGLIILQKKDMIF
jgi:hypothetical protein